MKLLCHAIEDIMLFLILFTYKSLAVYSRCFFSDSKTKIKMSFKYSLI